MIVSISYYNVDSSKEVAELTSGEVFGEMFFIDKGLPLASVETVEPSIVLSIPRHKLANRLYQDVGFASRFYRAISIFLSSGLRAIVKGNSSKDNSSVKQKGYDLDNLTLAQARYDWLKNLMN
ncbi:MAG: cyclic nucleotide-binding domain-containing protein [Prochloron sp. SP5CPC1]|nr:cyclic nucleotide-binding domain-containing protein [Candidatus Paraprochloron terpiosi SP5CPC1]